MLLLLPACLQPASARFFAEPEGRGDALTISRHASSAALRVAFGSPLPALLQISTNFARVLARSVGSCSTPCLHEATAEVTAGSFAVPVLGVEVVVELGVELGVELAVELGVVSVLGLVAAVELVELLDELPQPTNKATRRSAASGLRRRSRVMP